MSTDALTLLDRFQRLRVLVIGDPILDVYLRGGASRLSREAPVPNVAVRHRHMTPGGAANAASNLRALGAQVDFAGLFGVDVAGAELRALLSGEGVSTAASVNEMGRNTRSKTRVLADDHLLLTYDSGDRRHPGAGALQSMIAHVDKIWRRVDAVLVADYGEGTVSRALVEHLSRPSPHGRPLLAVDSRSRLRDLACLRPDIVKPNAQETAALLDREDFDGHDRAAAIAANAQALHDATGARRIAATLDRDGAVLLEAGNAPLRLVCPPCRHPSPAGAGDTFMAALVLALAAGGDLQTAGRLAQQAASLVIGKPGTTTCGATELRNSLTPRPKLVPDLPALLRLAAEYRRGGRRTVFANGCFDLLHAGHVAMLEHARSLGDVLIVGVNDDASARRSKGAGRPVNQLQDRLHMLAALQCVDHVVAFDADTAHALVDAIRPQVYIKGGNWQGRLIPEAALVESLGGRVEIAPVVRARSTQALMERVLVAGQVLPMTAAAQPPAPALPSALPVRDRQRQSDDGVLPA